MFAKSNSFIYVSILLGLLNLPLTAYATIYTTVANGDWTNAATWQGGVKPGADLSGHTVNIGHSVTYPSSLGDLLIKNGILNITQQLILVDVNLKMENTLGRVNLNGGLIILTNRNFENTQGIVTLTNGAVQLCNGNYTVKNSAQTSGTNGYIFSTSGNIELLSGTFSSNIKWCNDAGSATGLPTAENCTVARPPNGYCQDQTHYRSLNSSTVNNTTWNTPISLYKTFAGRMNYEVIGGSEIIETGNSGNCTGSVQSKTLSLPAGAIVKGAYIYWYAMERNVTTSQTANNYPFIAVSNTASANFKGTSLTIPATRNFGTNIAFGGGYIRYGARFADVTSLFPASPNGSYSVDVAGGASNSACPLRDENARAWSLVVVYEDPALTAANRIFIYDGMVGFVNTTTNIPVTGYHVPTLRPAGAMTSVMIQGDPGISGEFMDTSDTAFPNYSSDFANSSSGPALDIDKLSGNFTTGTNSMTLRAGSNGDVLSLTNAIVLAPSEMDFSDGPASYGSPVHGIPLTTTLYLGSAAPDDDINSQPSANADWDDTHGVDDEGGTIPSSVHWIPNQTENLPVAVQGNGYLSVWIDWNNDGDFDDANEQIVTAQATATGANNVSVTAPSGITDNDYTIRLRVCSDSNSCTSPAGYADDGEVEDSRITITTCTALTGDVSEVASAIPSQITAGVKYFVGSRTPSPKEGHLKAYAVQTTGLVSATAAWNAATLMTAAKRQAGLYSTNSSGTAILFNNLDDSAFVSTTPAVTTIKNYTFDPSTGGGIYLAGRRNGSFLGTISRGNALALVNSAINVSRYLNEPAYRTFYSGTVSGRSEKVLITGDDGFLYAFNQSDGELAWGWMPRSLVQNLKDFNNFQDSKYMRGKLDVIDIKDGLGSYATYVVGAYKNGLGHFVLKLSDTAGLSSVVWDEDLSGSFNRSPNRGEMTYFTDGAGTTWIVYILTKSSGLSTLVLHNALSTDVTEVSLNFNATSIPLIMPDFGDINGPAKKTLYLGDSSGNLRRAALLGTDGALNTATVLQTALQSTTYSGSLGASESIIFLGASVSSADPGYYLRVQSEARITLLKYNASTTNWTKLWTSYVSGAGSWDAAGTTFTIDNSGPPTDPDNDGFATTVGNGIQSLPTASRITDSAQVVADSIILPVTVPASGACTGKAYYFLYNIQNGLFTPKFINTNGSSLVGNFFIGYGDAVRASLGDVKGGGKLRIHGSADQQVEVTQNGTTASTGPAKSIDYPDSTSTGLRGWKEMRTE